MLCYMAYLRLLRPGRHASCVLASSSGARKVKLNWSDLCSASGGMSWKRTKEPSDWLRFATSTACIFYVPQPGQLDTKGLRKSEGVVQVL